MVVETTSAVKNRKPSKESDEDDTGDRRKLHDEYLAE